MTIFKDYSDLYARFLSPVKRSMSSCMLIISFYFEVIAQLIPSQNISHSYFLNPPLCYGSSISDYVLKISSKSTMAHAG